MNYLFRSSLVYIIVFSTYIEHYYIFHLVEVPVWPKLPMLRLDHIASVFYTPI
jgi:hypothetical protein